MASTCRDLGTFRDGRLKELQPLERQVLVEKHLISPLSGKGFKMEESLSPENEEVSIMVNEREIIFVSNAYFLVCQLREALMWQVV